MEKIMNQPAKSNQNIVTFEDFDKLKLKDFAENLFQVMEKGSASSISNIGQKGSYTISLNAQFGNGKTTFLKMFEHFMKKEKLSSHNVLFINAWESDFYKEPVIVILSIFVDWVEKEWKNTNQDTKQKQIQEEIVDTVKGVIGVLGNITKQAVQIKTGVDLTEIPKAYKSGKNLFTQEKVISKGDDIFNDFKIRIESIKEIKNILSKYLESNNKKLLIIVDELDRTKPDYAIHFLEDMKHFFDVENVIFLVAVNRKQMEATAKCLYGQDLDFEGYYRKFFKQEMDLPDPYQEAQKFIGTLLTDTQVKRTSGDGSKNVYLCCKLFQLTLREIENFMRMFELILKSKDQITKWTYHDTYAFCTCLYMKEKEVFKKILNKNIAVDDFIKYVDDQYNNYMEYNILFATVAFSLIKGDPQHENLMHERKKIERKFKVLQHWSDQVTIYPPDNFEYYNGVQPAVKICEMIDQRKSIFNN